MFYPVIFNMVDKSPVRLTSLCNCGVLKCFKLLLVRPVFF